MKKIKKIIGIFVEYMIVTWVNKLAAIVLLAVGIPLILLDNDATVFILMAMIAIPLFFAKRNWILV